MPLYTSHVGIVWDSGYGLSPVLLPTKTSCIFIQLFGRLLSLLRTFSQVFDTSLVNPLFCLIFDAATLSSVSLEFIT